MKNLGQMLKQAQEMQQRMAEAQEALEALEVEGAAGGGMVTARLNGKGDLKAVKIDPSLFNAEDVEVVEDLIVAAVGEARIKAREQMEEKMKEITGGMPLPDGFQMPF